MFTLFIASPQDLSLLMQSRLEMLKEVNHLPESYLFPSDFIKHCEAYFQNADQTTVLATDGGVVGCATLCYTNVMPTFSHPAGKRAHLMNVYTKPSHRGQGIASKMLQLLIDEALKRGVTEISLDATESGRPLYRKFGFIASTECMVLTLNG